MQRLLTLNAAIVLGGLACAVPSASAQRSGGGSESLKDAAPLSLQSQLGSIPLISPRAMARQAAVRMVRLTQISGHEPGERGAAGRDTVGAVREIACPETGCQQVVSLMVDNTPQLFLADIQFVGKGIYLTLHSRSAAIAAVVEFRLGRPGPVFIRGNPSGTTEQDIGFNTAAALSLRRLDPPADGKTLASGNVYTRKRVPDLVLRVEVDQAKEK